jgi:hypothetical protein
VPRDFVTVADVLGMHIVLMQRYGNADRARITRRTIGGCNAHHSR